MHARVRIAAVLLGLLSLPFARSAAACAECASADGVVGCRYRFFYGRECVAYWSSASGGFVCEESGTCDEVGPPDPDDGGGRRGPFNPTLPPGVWTYMPGPVEVPEAVFTVLTDISRKAIRPLGEEPGA